VIGDQKPVKADQASLIASPRQATDDGVQMTDGGRQRRTEPEKRGSGAKPDDRWLRADGSDQ
jgi:hypothetical protein